MNVVTLIGNLASDVDVREVGDSHTRASFRLAVDRRSGGGADFFDVTVWDKQATSCERFLSKGMRIALDGRLRSRHWTGPDGSQHRAVEVVARTVEFLWLRPAHATESPEPPEDAEPPVGEVVPLAERSMA